MRRNPDQWKTMQGKEQKLPTTAANAVPQTQPETKTSHPHAGAETSTDLHSSKSNKKRKRRDTRDEDEIDALFSGIGLKKMKGVAVDSKVTAMKVPAGGLDANILKAIKSAPSNVPRGK